MPDKSSPSGLKGKNIGGKIAVSLAVAALVYLLLALWAGWDELTSHLSSFDPLWLALAIGLATFNFLVRFVRYHLFLLRARVAVPIGRNLLYHFAGLSLTMTPGKVGEAIKSWFLFGEGYAPSRTLPTIFMERFTDLLAVLFLASLGVMVLQNGLLVFGLSAGVLLLMLLLLSTSRGVALLVALFSRLPLIGKKVSLVKELLENVHDYMNPRTLSWSLLIGIIGWGAEALAFFYIARGAGISLTLFEASFIYSISTLAGVVFPGGLGGMEGMMGVLLAGRGSAGAVVTIIFLIRLATLWWATLVGTAALFIATAVSGRVENAAEK